MMKVPLGIMPLWCWLELNPQPTDAELAERAEVLRDAIERYRRAGLAIPKEWQDEAEVAR